MPSKKSKPSANSSREPPKTRASVWKEKPGCSEAELGELARDLARELAAGHRVLLEGPMGAGKSTFARFLLNSLEVEQPPEGSPSFAIAHQYDLPARARAKGVAHIDLYRIKAEEEIDDAGLSDLCWNPELISVVEWASLWPEFERALERPAPVVWRVELAFAKDPEKRDLAIKRLA